MTVVSENGDKSTAPIPFEINGPRRLIKYLPSFFFKSLRNNLFRSMATTKKNGLTLNFELKPEKVARYLTAVKKIANDEQIIVNCADNVINLAWRNLDKDMRKQIVAAAKIIVRSGEFVKDFADIVKRAAMNNRLPKCYRDLFRIISDEWLPQKAFEWFDSIADYGVSDLAAYDRFMDYLVSYLRIIITCPRLNMYLTRADPNRIIYEIFTTVANEPVGNNLMDNCGGKWDPLAPSTIAWNAKDFIYHRFFRCSSGRFFREVIVKQHDNMNMQEIFDRFESMIHI